MMKWSLLELKKHQETPLLFSETLDLKSELMNRDAQILDIAPVVVEGLVTVSNSDYLVHYQVKTVLTLPSSRSLEPVAYEMDFMVDELFMTPEQFQTRSDLITEDEVLILDTQTLNVSESVADNILLEIPLQVLTEAEKQSNDYPSGDEWGVFSEEDYLKQKEETAKSTIDPRLAKLSQFLDANPEKDEK